MGLAFVVERLDRRIRTRAETEAAYALPVLAEVPQVKKAQRRDEEIVASLAPLSRVAEAYRAVRSSLLFTRAAMTADEASHSHRQERQRGGASAARRSSPITTNRSW